MQKKIVISFVLFLGVCGLMQAQDFSAFKKEVFVKGKYKMPYRILYPENYDADKSYPLLVFLHGSGERGSDNELQLVHGASLFLKEEIRKKYPAIVVFPQCPKEDQWSNRNHNHADPNEKFIFYAGGKASEAMKTVQKLIKNMLKTHKINEDQVYAGGLSMGGMGTFELVRRNPKLFAAAFPICGGANPEIAIKLKGTQWWVFHGDKDKVVPYQYSEQMVKSLEGVGAAVEFSLYPGVGHNSWDNAFQEPNLLPWLFSIKRP